MCAFLSRLQVPLWLAQVLKKRQKCQIIPPEWLNVEFLNEKKEGAYTAERSDLHNGIAEFFASLLAYTRYAYLYVFLRWRRGTPK